MGIVHWWDSWSGLRSLHFVDSVWDSLRSLAFCSFITTVFKYSILLTSWRSLFRGILHATVFCASPHDFTAWPLHGADDEKDNIGDFGISQREWQHQHPRPAWDRVQHYRRRNSGRRDQGNRGQPQGDAGISWGHHGTPQDNGNLSKPPRQGTHDAHQPLMTELTVRATPPEQATQGGKKCSQNFRILLFSEMFVNVHTLCFLRRWNLYRAFILD